SRRRHTRFSRDWSSDVCSSDLMPPWGGPAGLSARELLAVVYHERQTFAGATDEELVALQAIADNPALPASFDTGTSLAEVTELRSEERRVGKEGRSGW